MPSSLTDHSHGKQDGDLGQQSASMESKLPRRFVIQDLPSPPSVKKERGPALTGASSPPQPWAPGERTRLSLGSPTGAWVQLMEEGDRVQTPSSCFPGERR